MLWGLLEASLAFRHSGQTEMIQDLLLNLDLLNNQQAVLQYLLGNPDDPNLDPVMVKDASDKSEAVWVLIEALDRQLKSEPENNGVYPPQDPVRLDGY